MYSFVFKIVSLPDTYQFEYDAADLTIKNVEDLPDDFFPPGFDCVGQDSENVQKKCRIYGIRVAPDPDIVIRTAADMPSDADLQNALQSNKLSVRLTKMITRICSTLFPFFIIFSGQIVISMSIQFDYIGLLRVGFYCHFGFCLQNSSVYN